MTALKGLRRATASRFFTLKGREFHVGSYYQHKRHDCVVCLTGRGKSTLVVRRRGAAEFICSPEELGREVEGYSPVIEVEGLRKREPLP